MGNGVLRDETDDTMAGFRAVAHFFFLSIPLGLLGGIGYACSF